MKIIDYEIPYTNETALSAYLAHHYPNNKLLFFDIETTGFIAKNTTLYLIGVLWYADNKLYIRQWFNEDGKSERILLSSFTEFCKLFTHLVHFNGLGFDLSYLKQKAELLSLSFDLDQTMFQIDIYKEIRPLKNVLPLDNLKQISIEKYLNIIRTDTFSGKDLIKIYQQYITTPNINQEKLLLLHNHDDLLGMPKISHILNYKAFFRNININKIHLEFEEEQVLLAFDYDDTAYLTSRLALTHNQIYLNAMGQHATLHIPIIHTTLKHYFSDYKNYYYLPMEDMAIHKSVAAYVESSNKIKATQTTCYLKKTDNFIPCMDNNHPEKFQLNPSDKCTFQTLDSIQNGSFETQQNYIKNTLQAFL